MDKMVSTYSKKNKYMSFSYLVILHKYSHSHPLLSLSLSHSHSTSRTLKEACFSTYDHGLNSPVFSYVYANSNYLQGLS